MKKIKRIAITGRIAKSTAVSTAKKVIKLLERKKVAFWVDEFFPVQKEVKPLNSIKADMVLVFGGDGTMLHAFHELKRNVPVLGINCGARGTLMALTAANAKKELSKILNGKYSLEKRGRLRVEVDGKLAEEALNEVIIVPKKAGRLLHYNVRIDGQDLGEEADDGLIIATPTGSTAHALSAGGPKVMGNAKVFVIVRMNPIDLNRRPLLVNDNSKVEVSRFRETEIEAIIDGQHRFPVKKKIVARRGKEVTFALKK